MRQQRQTTTSTTRESQGSTLARPGATRSFGSNQERLDQIASRQAPGETVALEPAGGGVDGKLVDPPSGPRPSVFVACHSTRPAGATAQNTVDASALGTIGANTQYVEIADGPRWLDISTLSQGDRATVVTWLKESGGKITVRSDGRIVLGEKGEQVRFGADTEDPRKVLDGANAREQDADVWGFLNGGETALDASEADRTGWKDKQTKPGAWYNGYTLNEGEVSAHTSPFDTSGTSAPELDEAGLKALIMRCMDIGGIRDVMGDDKATFVAALTARFADGHALGEKGLAAVADELWSYLQTGAGTDGDVDIGRLQALVRAISPDTKATADTNTPFGGEAFAITGTDASLKRGDGVFGRATMLSLLHLFGALEKTLTSPPDIGTVPGGMVGEGDYFLNDQSGSMVGSVPGTGPWGKAKAAVDQSQGWGAANGMDTRTVGKFSDDEVTVGTTKLDDMGNALARAYTVLYPADTKESRDKFAALFGVSRRDIFDTNGLMPGELMRLLGDGAGKGFGAPGESSLKTMLFVLTHPEALPPGHPLRTRLELGSGDPSQDPVRLNAVADEWEQGLEYLELVRALADQLGVEVRIIGVPHGDADYERDPVNNLIFLDLDDVTLDPANDEATVEYDEGGKRQTQKVSLKKDSAVGSNTPYQGKMLRLPGLSKQGKTG
ncbi:MAG: hypothetical protein V4850_12070 [Myxococcota bacterium]